MEQVTETAKGIGRISAILQQTQQRVTRAVYWRVPHNTKPPELHLKIGRYLRRTFDLDTLESNDPKSELTLNANELEGLIKFIQRNHAPLSAGASKYISLDEDIGDEAIGLLKRVFNNPDKEELLEFIAKNNILPSELIHDIENKRRREAIAEFEEMLRADLVESDWQKWFEKNDWVLGSDFVRILDSRSIDTENISDYLVQAYDGFLDLIEIKRPGGKLQFWSSYQDHGNYVPSLDLIKAITQSSAYLFEIERELNSQKFIERMQGVQAIKPRCTLVFGRSKEWNDDQKRAYRILNSGYHNISILTYDHVLEKAKRIVGVMGNEHFQDKGPPALYHPDDDIPF